MAHSHRTNNDFKGWTNFSLPFRLKKKPSHEHVTKLDDMASALERRRRANLPALSTVAEDEGQQTSKGTFKTHFNIPSAATLHPAAALPLHHKPPTLRPGHSTPSLRTTAQAQSSSASLFSNDGRVWKVGLKPVELTPPKLAVTREPSLPELPELLPIMERGRPKLEPRDAQLPKKDDLLDIGQMLRNLDDDEPKSSMDWDSDEEEKEEPKQRIVAHKLKRKDDQNASGSQDKPSPRSGLRVFPAPYRTPSIATTPTHTTPVPTPPKPTPPQRTPPVSTLPDSSPPMHTQGVSPADSAKAFEVSPLIPYTRQLSGLSAICTPIPASQPSGGKPSPPMSHRNDSTESIGSKLKSRAKLFLRGNANTTTTTNREKSSTPASPASPKSPCVKKSPFEPPTSSKLRNVSNFDGVNEVENTVKVKPWELQLPDGVLSPAGKQAEARAFMEQTPPPPMPQSPARSAGRVLRSTRSDSSIRITASGYKMAPEVLLSRCATKIEVTNPDSNPLAYIAKAVKTKDALAELLADDPKWDAAVARVKARMAETKAEEERKAREEEKWRNRTPKQKAADAAKARIKDAERLIAHSSHAGYEPKKAYSDMTKYELELIGSIFEEELAEGTEWGPRLKAMFKKTTIPKAKAGIAKQAYLQRHLRLVNEAKELREKGEWSDENKARLDEAGKRMSTQIDRALVDLNSGRADEATARISRAIAAPTREEVTRSSGNGKPIFMKGEVLGFHDNQECASSSIYSARTSEEAQMPASIGDMDQVSTYDTPQAHRSLDPANHEWLGHLNRSPDQETEYSSLNTKREKTYQALCAPPPEPDDSPVGLGIFDADGYSIDERGRGREGATNRLGMRGSDHEPTPSELSEFMADLTEEVLAEQALENGREPDQGPSEQDKSPYQAARDRGSVLHFDKPALERKGSDFMRLITEKAKEREMKLNMAHPAMRKGDDTSSPAQRFDNVTNMAHPAYDHCGDDWRGLDSGLGDTFPSPTLSINSSLLDTRSHRQEAARLFQHPASPVVQSRDFAYNDNAGNGAADYGVDDYQGLDSGVGETFPTTNGRPVSQHGHIDDARLYERSWYDGQAAHDEGYGTAPLMQQEFEQIDNQRGSQHGGFDGYGTAPLGQQESKRVKPRRTKAYYQMPTPDDQYLHGYSQKFVEGQDPSQTWGRMHANRDRIEYVDDPENGPAQGAESTESLADVSDDSSIKEITNPTAWKPGTNIDINVDDVLAAWQAAPPSEHHERSTVRRPAMSQTNINRPVKPEDFSTGPNKPSLRKSLGLKELQTYQAAGTLKHPKHNFAFDTERVMCFGTHIIPPDLIITNPTPPPQLIWSLPPSQQPVAPFTTHLRTRGVDAQNLERCNKCTKLCCFFAEQVVLSALPAKNLTQEKAQKGAEERVEKLRALYPNGVDVYSTFLTCEECSEVVCPRCADLCEEVLCRQVMCVECSRRGGGRCGIYRGFLGG